MLKHVKALHYFFEDKSRLDQLRGPSLILRLIILAIFVSFDGINDPRREDVESFLATFLGARAAGTPQHGTSQQAGCNAEKH